MVPYLIIFFLKPDEWKVNKKHPIRPIATCNRGTNKEAKLVGVSKSVIMYCM